MSLIRTATARAHDALTRFLALESTGGLLLVAAGAAGMVAANTWLAPAYAELLRTPLVVRFGELGLDKPLLLWINDGLMAVFFLLVGLELKQEAVDGQFADRRRIVLPAACALGGMLVPMGVYALANFGDAAAMRGVAIPAATDIAFALGVLALLGSRVPFALKLLLTAIAVLDDLGAIVLIALFYTSGLSPLALGVALGCVAVLVALNRAGVARLGPYFFVGAILWFSVLKSGVHATLAGVVLALTIPIADRDDPERSPLGELVHALHPWVAFGILPLFAFANAGIPLSGLSLDTLAQPVPLGIAAGLALGKPVGVLAFAALALALGVARLPEGVRGGALAGMAMLCGIGFTMSLFIGTLAFAGQGPDTGIAARAGILAGSLVSAVLGGLWLRFALPAPAPR